MSLYFCGSDLVDEAEDLCACACAYEGEGKDRTRKTAHEEEEERHFVSKGIRLLRPLYDLDVGGVERRGGAGGAEG